MQTFLPYPDFVKSAKCLDDRRLGNQRNECKIIIEALTKRGAGVKGAWTNHPAVIMWEGYSDALKHYTNAVVKEWLKRGKRNTMGLYMVPDRYVKPEWLGNEMFHASHRSNLLRKDEEYYRQFGWTEDLWLEYVWPNCPA